LTRSRILRTAAAIAAALLLGTGTAHAGTAVNGISDQRVGNPNPDDGGWTQSVHQAADSVRSQLRYARYQVQWDVALLASTHPEVQKLHNWLVRAQQHDMRPLISFMPRGIGSGDQPSPSEYAAAVAQFRLNWPQVLDFTAWNEPNHPGFSVSALVAALYLRELMGVCSGACTVAAGDFSGNANATHTYWSEYRGHVDNLGLRPAVWAYHPYEAINDVSAVQTRGIADFISIIGADKEIWFTEVGAYYCQDQTYRGPEEQNNAAARLQTLSSGSAYSAVNRNLTRVYYYHFTGDYRELPDGRRKCDHDSGLFDYAHVGGAPRPAFYTIFPSGQPKIWELRLHNSSGPVDVSFGFGNPAAAAVAGDWNGDGFETAGTFYDGQWQLRNSHSNGVADYAPSFGSYSHIPVVGDWNGDGIDTVGVYAPTIDTFHLRNSNTSGASEINVNYGFPGGIPVVGDWNGDGIDTVGMWNPSTGWWFLRNSNTNGVHDIAFEFGAAGGTPVVGDWNGDGIDSIGIWDRNTGAWFLRNSNNAGGSDYGFYFGSGIHSPLAADWDASGNDTPGVVR
jgi:hypothetical protein